MVPALRLPPRDGDKFHLGACVRCPVDALGASGKLLSKDELIDKVWAGAVAEDVSTGRKFSAAFSHDPEVSVK